MSLLSSLSTGISRTLAYVGIYNSSGRDSARHDIPETAGWAPRPGFAGSFSNFELDTILGRARDGDKNNGWINGGIDRRVEAVMGGNIQLSAQPAYRLLKKDFEWRMQWTADVQARWRVYANDVENRCDVRRRLSVGQMAALAYLHYIRDGEAAAEVRDLQRGLSNPTSLLLFEAERISTPNDRSASEGPNLRNGVVLDNNGAPIGYWIRSRNALDPTPGAEVPRWDYVPRFGPTGRAKLLHVFNPRYAEQNRGISRLAEILVPAKMLDRVDRAEVQAALKSAIMSIFIKSPGTVDDLSKMLAPAGESNELPGWVEPYLDHRMSNRVMMDGASVFQLFPDEDVVAPNASHPNSNYPDFAAHVLRKIASSLGLSYPQISQEWSGINYSSARALLNEIWRGLLQDRRYFCQQFLTPFYAAWLEWEVANGDVKIPGGPANFYRKKSAICACEWIGPGRGSVDPLKEANAANLDTAAGRRSSVSYILEDQRDPDDVMAEEQWFNMQREERGLAAANLNVKAAADAGSEDGGDATGTQEDRDGDGEPQEDQKRKQQQRQNA